MSNDDVRRAAAADMEAARQQAAKNLRAMNEAAALSAVSVATPTPGRGRRR
ncbi:hypothetical protein [Streptomyces sp. H39-C1]|uniref:hypothetical protein n=1 Tax=Streptomyces sp. H39-C1 TaxID=3004355 RepID=UPI0022AE6AB9|nr:hypothetical protein [Streptomyces sp. H39-C1]MCZ4098019.1 hypothetical protein [Streptomyces sp. H39-C1]